ncbi:MAG: serine/threonine protein kinase [Myxococcales bacterium]|nr:serine/threonine protein kinase [Myxococcales bacterium]
MQPLPPQRSFCTRCYGDFTGGERYCPRDGTPLLEAHATADQAWPVDVRIADRYVPRRLLGTGAMARVYVADDLRFDRKVALKILAPEVADDATQRERFLVEARATMRIRHPNVVRTHDCGEVDGVPFMVMELVRGESLDGHLRRLGPMAPFLALEVARQAALGLDAVHASGVVHRDIKPGNLVLPSEGGAPHGVKLIDFGMASLRERRITDAGTVLGTVEYMAPEQVVADPSDARTDLYGLGTVLYRAFTGETPFGGSSVEDYLAHQLASQPPPPSWLREELGKDLDAVVLTLLRKHPDNRYASAADLVADLDRLLEPTAPPPVLAPQRVEPDCYLPASALGRAYGLALWAKIGRPAPWASAAEG